MYGLYIVTGMAFLISLIQDPQKTKRALRIALKKLMHILPAFLTMLVLVSISLVLLPERFLLTHLGSKKKFLSLGIASAIGSVTLMPGFIAFPLCGILLQKGVLYMILSAFSTSLMMVGVLTFPVEKKYFGTRITVMRNFLSLLASLLVALATGIAFREIP